MIVYHGAKAHSCCGDGIMFQPGEGYMKTHARRRLGRPELLLVPEPEPPPLPVKVLVRDGVWLDPPEEVTP
jgi:hypothetical protein